MTDSQSRGGDDPCRTSGTNTHDPMLNHPAEESKSGSNPDRVSNSSNSWTRFSLRKRKKVVSETGCDDEDLCLEDILSSSRHVAEQAEELVKKVITAGWNLVHHHALPDWLQDNEHLVQGHRPPTNSFRTCFMSIFSIHTETGNIWTHLIGMMLFIPLFVYTLNSRYLQFMWQDITVHSVFYAGIVLCLCFSWLFHTVFCHSESVSKLFSKLDYCGISLLIIGSAVPWIYYSFYCQLELRVIYTTSISVLGLACIVISLSDKFATPEYRALRAGLFTGLGLTGGIPMAHIVLVNGLDHAFLKYGVGWAVLMGGLYISGAVIYAMRIPERLFPGKFDIWFQSHQIFHVCVVLAAFANVRGLQTIASFRLDNDHCPTVF